MTKVLKIILLLTWSALLLQPVPCGAASGNSTGVRFIPMKCERLPDLNIPRAGHQVFVADGELVVVGGHTEGFARTATAEYFKDGEWHTFKTLYPHDNGFSLKLSDGDYLVGGGHGDDFGIGQSFGVERYNPSAHSFTSFPILDIKRAYCSAALLPSGGILVSGNWYADDAVGLSDGENPFETTQPSSQDRSSPYIFTYGKSDAVIFGVWSGRGEKIPPVIDRLYGEAYTDDLLLEWTPWMDWLQQTRADQIQVTDPETGSISYLFWGTNQEGRIAILRFKEGVFSRVQTDFEIPIEGPWGAIHWYTSVYTDRKRETALVAGVDEDHRVYLLSMDYRPMFSGGAGPIKVYYSAPDPNFSHAANVILPDGRFVTTGGIFYGADPMSNYNPSAAVLAFSPFEDEIVAEGGSRAWWPWTLVVLALLLSTGIFRSYLRRKKRIAKEKDKEPQVQSPGEKEKLLYQQLCQMMEKEELYKRQGLSLADVSSRMRTNTKYISSCISTGAGCSFVEFVNGYRIRKAKVLLQKDTALRMNEVSEAVGFANESSFYRNFKNIEGCTPQQWLEKRGRNG